MPGSSSASEGRFWRRREIGTNNNHSGLAFAGFTGMATQGLRPFRSRPIWSPKSIGNISAGAPHAHRRSVLGVERIEPDKFGEAREIGVSADDSQAVLDGERGERGVADQVASQVEIDH
ncbi:hypothetical protein AXFE_19740 [Acidithrix ferrooxidans]|uniref:Uncharacterized protein n=1 Tax=Acidithrix ferrooxidans TaxID=1280514 RepID=A0A0D8HGP2_9ACTN|nr:hypothetical protein AXFE_19740 [Acidithrix ferrooxidans]